MEPNLPVASPQILKIADATSQNAIHSLLVTGMPRKGKFYGTRPICWDWADEREGAMVCLFPHAEENGPILAEDLHARGHAKRIYCDDLDNPDFVLPFKYIPRSDHSNPIIREMENASIVNCLLELFNRGRVIATDNQYVILELFLLAVWTIIKSTCRATLRHLKAMFIPGHPLFYEVLNGCWDSELVWKCRQVPMQGSAARRETAAFHRLVDQKVDHPQILYRDGEDDHLERFLVQKAILIINGSILSARATATHLGMLSIMVMQIIRRLGLKVLLLADEITGFGLFSDAEKKGVQQLPKRGLHYIGISHTNRLMKDPDDNAEANQAFHSQHMYGSGDFTVAEQNVRSAAGGALDPYLEHYTDVRYVQRHDGFDSQEDVKVTRSKGKSGENSTESQSEAKGERLIPRYSYERQDILHLVPFSMQFEILAAKLVRAGLGKRLVSMLGRVYWEQVPELDRGWLIPEIAEVRMAKFYQEMYSRPEYKKPSLPEPVEMLSLPSSKSTQQQSTNSSNGHSEPSPKSSPSKAAEALHELLQRTGRRRDVP
jgi:hypothetical protein